MRRWIVWIGVAALATVAVGAAALAWTIGPRNLIGMAMYDQRREGALRVGDLAPDVMLLTPGGAESASLLGARRPDRPLVVVFGSFT